MDDTTDAPLSDHEEILEKLDRIIALLEEIAHSLPADA